VPAAAQVVEIGAGIGRGCIGDSSGFCGDETGPMWAIHSSVWLDDTFEMGARFAVLPLPDVNYSVAHDDRFSAADDPAIRQLARIDVTGRERSRRIISGEATYHFPSEHPVGFLLGLGVGVKSNRTFQSCVPTGCERLMPILSSPVGHLASRTPNLTIIIGASGRIKRRIEMRGGIRLHNFAGEESSTTEIFFTTGYRFGHR